MQSNNSKTYELVLTALFMAIIIVMAFTPLGYIPLVVINATTLHIPVIIGSLFLGPKKGGFLGGVFGLTSLYKSSIAGGSLSAFVFSPVAAIQMLPHDTVAQTIAIVLKSTFIPVVPRILIGVVPYFVYVGIKKAISSEKKVVYGSIINAVISFLIIAFTLFIIVKVAMASAKKRAQLKEKVEQEKYKKWAEAHPEEAAELEAKKAAEAAEAGKPVVDPVVALLEEIRDTLQEKDKKAE
jgi:uncharacterized membrane protein